MKKMCQIMSTITFKQRAGKKGCHIDIIHYLILRGGNTSVRPTANNNLYFKLCLNFSKEIHLI